MSEGNGTLAHPPYIECEGCGGRGFVKARIDAETRIALGLKDPAQKTIIRDHDRCNGAGILILRHTGRDGRPFYGKPKLAG